MPKQHSSKKTRVSKTGTNVNEENTPIETVSSQTTKVTPTTKGAGTPKDIAFTDKTNVKETVTDTINLRKRKASSPAGTHNITKKVKGNEGNVVDKAKIAESKPEEPTTEVTTEPSKPDTKETFKAEIKYSGLTRAYETGVKVVREHLEAKFPGLEIIANKTPDKDKFDVMIKKKDKEVISYSKGILGDPLPTKRNIAKFEEKLKKGDSRHRNNG